MSSNVNSSNNDKKTSQNTNYNFRFIFTILSALALGINFNNIDYSFFTAVLMFCFPIYYDTIKCISRNKILSIMNVIIKIILYIIFLVAIIGIMGILNVNHSDYAKTQLCIAETFAILNNFHFPAVLFYYAIMIVTVLSCIYLFAERNTLETLMVKVDKELKDIHNKEESA